MSLMAHFMVLLKGKRLSERWWMNGKGRYETVARSVLGMKTTKIITGQRTASSSSVTAATSCHVSNASMPTPKPSVTSCAPMIAVSILLQSDSSNLDGSCFNSEASELSEVQSYTSLLRKMPHTEWWLWWAVVSHIPLEEGCCGFFRQPGYGQGP